MTRGGRNLLLLGVGSVALTVAMTVVSLVIYHNSGDIYLDRSRPGFLPEKTEISPADRESTYSFGDSGVINGEVLEEYLNEMQKLIDLLDKMNTPFAPTPLTDKSLGIPGANETNGSSVK